MLAGEIHTVSAGDNLGDLGARNGRFSCFKVVESGNRHVEDLGESVHSPCQHRGVGSRPDEKHQEFLLGNVLVGSEGANTTQTKAS